MGDPEKDNFEHKAGASDSGSDHSHGFTPEEQKHIIRKIDVRLILTLGLLYCVSLIDRTNMGNAAIAGMAEDLVLINNKYQIASLVFFTTYVAFQPPATIACRKIGPRLFLPTITLLWGILMIGMGFTKTFEQLAALRVVLGVLEAGFFPGAVYLLSTWYTRYEVGRRYSLFYLIGCVAAAFAGILAFGFQQMKGIQGMNGWQWIFVMEGVLTCVLGFLGYLFVVDFPDKAQRSFFFLKERELNWVIDRVQRDRGDALVPKFNFRLWLGGGADWKVWAYAMIFFNTTTVTYALAYFLPIILRDQMGFDVGEAQCLVAPPYALAGILMWTTSWVGDRYHLRGPIVCVNVVLMLIGLPILGFHKNSAVRYFGVFLTTAGANSNVPAVLSYQANNIRGQWKRAFCSALLVGFGGIGGICGTLVFRDQDKATGYKPGMYAAIACSLLTLILVGLLTIDHYIQNKKADRGEKVLEPHADDAGPGFRYTY